MIAKIRINPIFNNWDVKTPKPKLKTKILSVLANKLKARANDIERKIIFPRAIVLFILSTNGIAKANSPVVINGLDILSKISTKYLS